MTCRLGCRVGAYPFGVSVVHGPSAGRAGKPRTHSGRARPAIVPRTAYVLVSGVGLG